MHQQSARAALLKRLRLWLNSFQNERKLLSIFFFFFSYSVNNAVLPVHCRENVLHGVIPIAGAKEPSTHTRNYAKWRRVCYSRSHPNTAETQPNQRAYSERSGWLFIKNNKNNNHRFLQHRQLHYHYYQGLPPLCKSWKQYMIIKTDFHA